MDAVHTQGIWIAESLQLSTKQYEHIWLFASHMGDPKAAFLLIFPLTYFVSRQTGVAVVWVAAISEWLNLVFKWILFGERPYWWIKESGLFEKNPPQLQQFPSTCETGPGSPSGHAMITGAVWWVMASTLASEIHTRTGSKVVASLPYLIYVLLLAVIGLSRIFILAHFPHQVIAGFLTGIVLGVYLSRSIPKSQSLLFYLRISMGILVGTLVLHTALEKAGIPLSWSVALAKKWCAHAEWVRLDTNPFSSIVRASGALSGLGLAQSWKPGGWSLSWAPRALCVALSAMALHHINRVNLPMDYPVLFYTLFFVKYTLVPQVVILFIPGVVHFLTAKAKRD
ncbi:glucose-6-phosphatase 3 [Alosa pseudoharengus]|uniref:glucose-6-phosphatase 3 n=1 Tax=Alosa pseudoharengus TaxID=34774 RepID=UPI003F88852A